MKMMYTDIKLAAEKYAHTARMHPDQFWSIMLLSAANMIAALCDQSEKRWIGGEAMIDVDTEGVGLVNGKPPSFDPGLQRDAELREQALAAGQDADELPRRRPMPNDEPELFPHAHEGEEVTHLPGGRGSRRRITFDE